MEKEKALEELLEKSKKQGYILFDEVDETADKYDLSIIDFDWLTKKLSLLHTQILDEPPKPKEEKSKTAASPKKDEKRCSEHEEYNIYDKIVRIDPALESVVEKVKTIVPEQPSELPKLLYDLEESRNIDSNLYEQTINRLSDIYLRVVLKLSLKRYEAVGGDLSELINIATIGMMNAIITCDTYDCWALSTYLNTCIYRAFTRNCETPNPLIHCSIHARETYGRLQRRLIKEFGKDLLYLELVDDEIFKYWLEDTLPYDTPDYIYEQIITLCKPNISLEDLQERYEDAGIIRHELINEQDPIYNAIVSDIHDVLVYVCSKLTKKEREIIDLRYGIVDGKQYTLQECGDKFDLTRERVRQIEKKATQKLRIYLLQMKINRSILNIYDYI